MEKDCLNCGWYNKEALSLHFSKWLHCKNQNHCGCYALWISKEEVEDKELQIKFEDKGW